MKIKLNSIFEAEVQWQVKSSWPLIKRPRAFLHLVLEHKRRYNGRKENVHQSNKAVETMDEACADKYTEYLSIIKSEIKEITQD